MSTITLVVIPGPGARTVNLPASTTVADLVCQENLHGREIVINGAGVPAADWQTTVVQPNSEVFATGSVKGNVDLTATLVVIPGPGARTVTFPQGSTVADLVCQENLHGREIVIDGAGIPAADWQNRTLTSNSEIFATGSVKGN